MFSLFRTILLLLTFTCNLAIAGQEVGNGGDAVKCIASGANSFEGYYSLDYLAKYDAQWPIANYDSLDAILDRIESGLSSKIPHLSRQFKEFRQDLFNETNLARKHHWERVPFGLVDLQDEQMVVQLPENCRQGEKTSIVQAVIRQSPSFSGLPEYKLRFSYVADVVNELKNQNAVQLSFLIIHEWLWEFSNNVERNRTINYWLHSARLENWELNEWTNNLEAIGFNIPGRVSSVWHPNICLPDLNTYNRLLEHQGPGRVREILIGQGQAYKRNVRCPLGSACTYQDNTQQFINDYQMNLPLDLVLRTFGRTDLNELMVMHLRDSMPNSDLYCNNTINSRSFVGLCSLTLPNTIKNQELTPVIGRDCVIYKGQKTTGFIIEEFVLYFPNLQL